MLNRKKVVLSNRSDSDDDQLLALTDDQIKLLKWLLDRDIICSDDWDIHALDETEEWVEV